MNTEQKIFEVVLELKDKLSGQTANVAKKTNDSLAGLQRTVGGLKTAFIGLVGITSVGMFFKTITDAAMQQEAAISKLNSVLKSTGQYSVEASQSLATYATQLQRTIGIGDELTLSIMGTVGAIAKLSADELPRAGQAVIQLANVYNMDYQSAASLLGKTLESNTNAFARYGLQLGDAKTAHEKLNAIIEKTGVGMDIAKDKANTYQGRIEKLKAAVGDLWEAFGMLITQSDELNGSSESLTEKIIALTDWMNENQETAGKMANALGGIIAVILGARGLIYAVETLTAAYGLLATAAGGALVPMLAIAGIGYGVYSQQDNLMKMFGRGGGKFQGYGQNQTMPFQFVPFSTNMKTSPTPLQDFMNVLQKDTSIDSDYLGSILSFVKGKSGHKGIGGGIGGGAPISSSNPLPVEIVDPLFEELMKTMRENEANKKQILARDLLQGTKYGGGWRSSIDFNEIFGGMNLGQSQLSMQSQSFIAPTDEEYKRQWIVQFQRRKQEQLMSSAMTDTMMAEGLMFPTMMIGKNKGGVPTWQRNDFLMNLGMQAAGTLAGGGSGRDMIAGLLPAIGSAFGPVGAAVGGIVGALIGRKKPRGDSQSNPVFTHDVNVESLLTAMLNVTKSARLAGGGAGIAGIDYKLASQRAIV